MKWLAMLIIPVATAIYAADTPPKAETFLDPDRAGRDYLDQGEYKNDWGGAQVIALGADNFRMVTYRGGLPGDGWDKEFKQETAGKRTGDKIVFTGENNYRAELANGKITITTENGGPYTMEKTGRKSPTLGAKPPAGAVVLFDGTGTDGWVDGHMDERHLLAAGCKSRLAFTNCTAHIKHNGVTILQNLELNGPTPGGKAESPDGGPLQLQGHGNPVFYRNIWVVPK